MITSSHQLFFPLNNLSEVNERYVRQLNLCMRGGVGLEGLAGGERLQSVNRVQQRL